MSNAVLHIDFETRSACDLKAKGLACYIEDPTTEIILMSYAFGDGEIYTWYSHEPFPPAVALWVESGQSVAGHNFSFEWALWNYIGIPKHGIPVPLKIEQGVCTQAMAYAIAVPPSLEKAALALGISKQKDMAGSRLMMKMCKPKADGGWHTDPEDLKRLAEYCRQDVEVEREISKRIPWLKEEEQSLWVLDQIINWRGIQVDKPALEKAVIIIENEKAKLDSDMRVATNGEVMSCTATKQLTEYLKAKGIDVESVDKATIVEILSTKNLSPEDRMVCLLRQEGSKSSTAKLEAMLQRASSDNRVRGTMQFHGASATGRWAGRGVQIHNFPRCNYDDATLDAIFNFIHGADLALSPTVPSPITAISNSLRAFIVAADGYRLIGCDYKSIESRILAWLAGEFWKVKLFEDGGDPYVKGAIDIFKLKTPGCTKDQRQVGKVAELACGFQGGVAAIQVMASAFGIKMTDEEAEKIKKAWRFAHPNIENFWFKLERAAMAAVRNPGKVFEVHSNSIGGPSIKYKQSGSFLLCKLPSGRCISYPYPKVEQIETPWGALKDGLTYMGTDSVSHKWERQKAYGGLLAENVTQAVGRCLLGEALKRLEHAGYPVVFHVHDEAVAEVMDGRGSVGEMEKIMSVRPAWAKGLPIAVEGFEGKRYTK